MSKEMMRREESRPEAVEQDRWLKPACDVFESPDEWLIRADLPGVGENGLGLHLDKSELSIEARRHQWFGEEGLAGYRRLFSLPAGVDADAVKAEIVNGVVTIHLPKSAAIKPRQIQVKAG